MKTEKTEMIMKYFDVTLQSCKTIRDHFKGQTTRQIKALMKPKKEEPLVEEEVLKEILTKGKILKKAIDEKK